MLTLPEDTHSGADLCFTTQLSSCLYVTQEGGYTGENADAEKATSIQDLNWFYGIEMTGLGEPPRSMVNASTEPKACSALCSQNTQVLNTC